MPSIESIIHSRILTQDAQRINRTASTWTKEQLLKWVKRMPADAVHITVDSTAISFTTHTGPVTGKHWETATAQPRKGCGTRFRSKGQ